MIKYIPITILLFLTTININAQVADSIYSLGSKFYNSNDKESAKKCLIALIERPMSSKDSAQRYSVLGYRYYVNLTYDLLKMIYFEQEHYLNALRYNEKQFGFLLEKGRTRCLEDIIIGISRDSFVAECYFAMKEYKNAMEISSRPGFSSNERMSIIFVNSASHIFGEEALREEFLEEYEKVGFPDLKVEYDSSDVKHIRKKISGPWYVILNIFGYKINIYSREIEQIRNDFIAQKITQEIVNNKLKAEIKKQPIYKLIMEN